MKDTNTTDITKVEEPSEHAQIKSIEELLKMPLTIPDYQRPYKWTTHNVSDLLDDIETAIEQSRHSHGSEGQADFKYRIGTIILHRNDQKYEIVDGQQRTTTLLLLRRYLMDESIDAQFIDIDLRNSATQANLAANYSFIRDWFSSKTSSRKDFLNAFSNVLEVVVITVEKLSEAFQLFDSQNSRGRAIDPPDLLKAYHLREMKDDLFNMQRAVIKWEARNPSEINTLFHDYLFPIIKWSDKNKWEPFTAQQIDIFKGSPVDSPYSYVARTRKAMPSFQITESFIAGGDFFSMVDYYLDMHRYLDNAIQEKSEFREINKIMNNSKWNESTGFKYAKTLFKCALLRYYDRFSNLDKHAVEKLFLWAFMLRVDMQNLSLTSVNRYSIGTDSTRATLYTNNLPMFSIIDHARTHTEISNLQITVEPKENGRWNNLYEALKNMTNNTIS
ncbi:DUF262 domain-containing protein [Bifidobacterium gallicum]|uniref:Uncharacterized protein n=1 Tax=Bifidobacterium gallicum DSM 20093 = LMG 11596 TaxID=561180 RepID=D1NV85_9BIFI|nr:DUF262 domain-containing protein [Bifidobacterium gallicum]EFA22736.1 hypothetical protein BIFGAL_03769 [Bifidobacterium gallicum DSM 20093 = LMG 11596]KFI59681.1 hypothetical protein BGLCM_0350 [Bifidobacterium gallicum DSM 20093 = LMG 11596]